MLIRPDYFIGYGLPIRWDLLGIVMGQDAWEDRSSDFVAFRDKNKGRLSPAYRWQKLGQCHDYANW